jgi:hypothetical protein
LYIDNLSLSQATFFCKGVSLSKVPKIPYVFFPIPPELLTDDFLDDPKMMRLIKFIFKRISALPSRIPLKKQKKHLELDPFEFMFGRQKCEKETGLSSKSIRGRMGQLIGLKFIEKVENEASKRASTFTVYRLLTGSFKENKGQHKGEQKGQHMGQHKGHNLDSKNLRKEEDARARDFSVNGNTDQGDPYIREQVRKRNLAEEQAKKET